MARKAERPDRWGHLVSGAFDLEERIGGAPNALEEVLRYLDSVLEVFPSRVDPVEDFEGYAVRRMALGLRSRLAPLRQGRKRKG